jgi:hypothetical protein
MHIRFILIIVWCISIIIGPMLHIIFCPGWAGIWYIGILSIHQSPLNFKFSIYYLTTMIFGLGLRHNNNVSES